MNIIKPKKYPTLYYCPGHLSFAPHVVLNELGKPFELARLSIKAGDTQRESFRKLNPKGKVPVLITENEILTESSAILLYLALSHPESGLLPPTPVGAARAIEWLNWLSCMLTGVIALNFHPSRFTDEVESFNGIKARGRLEVIKVFEQINHRLAENQWALKEGYSIVDPVVLIYFRWGTLLELDMNQFSHWAAHTQCMLQRPAVQKALATEEIVIGN
jgi:glutathione S-transferase